MKTIEFGYSNDTNPKGSWEGIGIKEGLMLTEADYYGVVKYEDNSYLIAKVKKDEYGRYQHLFNNFIVRPAIADLYPDGSGVIFLDQSESYQSKQLEEYLNSIKDKINSIDDIFNYCDGIVQANKAFTYLTLDDRINSTSISHEEFEIKNNALKKCHMSFSELQLNIQEKEISFKR